MPGRADTCKLILSPGLARARLRRGRALVLCSSLAASLVLLGVLAIPLFLLGNLLPWTALPMADWQHLGVLLAGTLRAAAYATLVAVPLGIATAMFTAQFCAPALRAWLKPALEILEAIPTVVLGLVAATAIAPWLNGHVATLLALLVALPALLLAAGFLFGTRVDAGWLPLWLLPLLVAAVAIGGAVGAQADGAALVPSSPWNALLVGLALGFATLPIVFSIAEDALFLVPRAQTQAAFALGATRWQALRSVLLPAAGPGLLAAALLGVARCLGETMIVLMASGNTPIGGFGALSGLRSVSADLALGLPEAAPGSAAYRGLLLAALALLASTLALDALADALRARLRSRVPAGARAT